MHRLAELTDWFVPTMTPAALADALVDFMIELQAERSFAVALMEAAAGDGEKREAFRASFRASITLILIRASPDCAQPKAQAMTAVVLHILTGLATATPETRR